MEYKTNITRMKEILAAIERKQAARVAKMKETQEQEQKQESTSAQDV
jgi:hypothetical protein